MKFFNRGMIFKVTRKLFYENLYATEFDAEVLSQSEHDGKFFAVLDKTIFFPGGGGQPCDTGTINNIEVLEVFEQGDEIVHVLKDELKEKNVHCVLNWPRRFEFMQQHLGEHIFAGMLYNLHGLHTARMRIEGDNVSIDIDSPVELSVILEAEAAANEAVWKNLPVEVLYPSMEEIKERARKLPGEKSVPPIRIINIPGVDYVPCCGVHVAKTGEVGLIKITSFENHKGGTRIYLKSGAAAYRWLSSLYGEVRKAEAELVCGYEGINEKILNLKAQIKDLKAEGEKNLERFLKPVAENLIRESGGKIIKHVMTGSTQEEVKHLFKLITDSAPGLAVLLASRTSDGAFIMFGTDKANKNIDVRPAFKAAIKILEGKGGGSSFSAQGWGKNLEALDEALNEAQKILES